MVAQLKKEVAQVCCAQHSVLLRYKHMLKKSLVKFSVCFKVAGSSEAMASSRIISLGHVPLASFALKKSTGIVRLFKHLLCVFTHPQFLVLELQAPMGACPGHYCMYAVICLSVI